MNKALAHILKNKLTGTPFIDKLAGLVYTAEYQDVTYDEEGGNKTVLDKKIPLSCDVDINNCEKADLVPDSSKKGILYFEDGGITSMGSQGKYQIYRSKLRLVAWLNTNWIKNDACTEAAGILMNDIINKLKELNLTNETPFVRLDVKVDSIPKQDKSIFSPYTYDNYNTQFILPPYEYFAIDLSISYLIPYSCIKLIAMRSASEYADFKNCNT